MKTRNASKLITAGLVLVLLSTTSAHAHRSIQGVKMQGITLNGVKFQGITLNGIKLQGRSLQGRSIQGRAQQSESDAFDFSAMQVKSIRLPSDQRQNSAPVNGRRLVPAFSE